jgi:hypothetical protein
MAEKSTTYHIMHINVDGACSGPNMESKEEAIAEADRLQAVADADEPGWYYHYEVKANYGSWRTDTVYATKAVNHG